MNCDSYQNTEEKNAFKHRSLPAVVANDAGFGREGGGVDRLVEDPLVAVRECRLIELLHCTFVSQRVVQEPMKMVSLLREVQGCSRTKWVKVQVLAHIVTLR